LPAWSYDSRLPAFVLKRKTFPHHENACFLSPQLELSGCFLPCLVGIAVVSISMVIHPIRIGYIFKSQPSKSVQKNDAKKKTRKNKEEAKTNKHHQQH
jgi:hypothetical protein